MPIETKEKFAPNSFVAAVGNEAKLILEYDLTNLGYYRISPLKEKAFLYSGEKPAGKKSYNLKKEVELAKDDLVAIKSFDNNDNIAYVIVLSGEENLKHGWVKLADIRNANSSTIPTNLPPNKVGMGKVDLISKMSGADGTFPPTLYLDSKGNKPNKKISYKQQLGAFPPNTPLKRLSKKSKNYIKVRLLAGPFLGAEGYVFKQDVAEPPDPNTFNKNRYKTVELTLDGALTRLNDEFASKKIEELTGLANLSLKAPTALNIIQRKILDKLSPKDFIQSNVCYYNQTDKTLDILLPFFFGPSTSSPSVFEANLAKIKDKGEEKGLLYVETYAKAKSLFSDYKPDPNEDKIPESFLAAESFINSHKDSDTISVEQQVAVYKQFSNVSNDADLASDVIIGDIDSITKSCSEFIQINPQALKNTILAAVSSTNEGVVFAKIPNTVTSPRWGFYVCKIPVSLMETEPSQPFLTSEGAEFLGDFETATAYGLDELHLFLRKAPQLVAKTLDMSVEIDQFEKDIQQISILAEKYNSEMESVGTKILVGETEQNAVPQKPIEQQIDLVEKFPTFLKAGLITGVITPEAIKSVTALSTKIQIKTTNNNFDKLSSLTLDFTNLEGVTSAAAPVINNVVDGEPQIIKLYNGKVSLLEKEFYDLINKTLENIDLSQFNSQAGKIETLLGNKKEEDNRDNYSYIYEESKNDFSSVIIYVLCEIVRQAVRDRELDLGPSVPFGFQITDIVDGKVVDISDYNKLTGPYIFGRDFQTQKVITYKPDFTLLLRQFNWIVFDEQSKVARLNWTKIKTKSFSAKSHDVISPFGNPEYSIISCCNSIDIKALKEAKNYKDFFDRLYKYQIFYKEVPSTAQTPNPITTPIKTPSNKSPELNKQFLEALARKRYTITEQAFGGTGCVEFALKSVRTYDDLYKNIMHKANWSLFIAQTIDRFKCELSKLGGGDLECLANFDTMGTYTSAMDAKEVVNNFPKVFNRRIKEQPTAPILDFIYNRKIPKMPSIDWYKCLRGFLLSLVLKVTTELITAFVQAILSLLNVQCGADFSKCEQGELDPLASDTSVGSDAVGQAAAAGINDADALRIVEQLQAINIQITSDSIGEFISFVASQMSIANFKSLLGSDTPAHIFSQGKILADDFFQPLNFSDEQFRAFLDILDESYQYEAFIAATLFQQLGLATSPDQCPPQIVDGDKTVQEIKSALEEKLRREGKTLDSEAIKKETEERIKAFCELLSFASGLANEIKTAPALLAGFSNFAISGAVSNIVSQLRVKPFYDYELLKFMFTGDLVGDNPTQEDIIRADLSLAFNVVYSNYLLSGVVKDDGNLEKRSFRKQFNLDPIGLSQAMGQSEYSQAKQVLRNDSFEKEFLQDLLQLVMGFNPFLLPFLPAIEGALFDVPKLNETDKMFLGASRDLNNPNYFYSWAENLIALLPIPFVDPRRFPAKYPNFVQENYPNAIDEDGTVSRVEDQYELSIEPLGQEGVRYKVGNDNETLLDMKIDLEKFTVRYGNQFFTRDLPKLSEPFFVDETKDYLQLAKQNTEASDIIKPNSPQKRLFLSIVEESAKKIINNSDDRKQFYTLLNSFYDELNSDINKLLQDAFSNAPEDVTSFFFKPYLEAQKFDSAKMKELGQILSGDKKGDKAKAAKDMQNMLKEMSNPRPPAALFFRRSDNLFSEVFFEGTLRQEVDKVMTKITASLKSFYENLTDGEEYNPKEVEGRIQAYYQNTEVFYEVQKQAAKKIGQVYSTRLTPNRQKQILEAVREVLG